MIEPVDGTYNLEQFLRPDQVVQLRLDFRSMTNQLEDQFTLELASPSSSLFFELCRQDLRSPDFRRVFSSGRIDNSRQVATQFKGAVLDNSSSPAFFTFDDEFLLGHWETAGTAWVLEPLWLTQPTAPHDIYLLFQENNLMAPAGKCRVGTTEYFPTEGGRNGGWIGAREIDLAVAVDSLMYRQFSDSESLENFILGLLALVQGDYDRGFNGNLCFQLSNLYFSDGANPEPWTTSVRAESLISSLRDWGNAGSWEANFDMAALWTGRDLSADDSGNSNIGFAYINAVCSDRRYHVVENWSQNSSALRAIWSHEIGHNLGARHVSGTNLIMNGTLSSGNRFWSATARGAIDNSLRNFDCLDLSPWLLFNAVGEGQQALLNWSFTWQVNNEGFFVERADTENGTYTVLGWVAANAPTGSRLYAYIDEGLRPGEVYFYRLRQVNQDGTEYITPFRRVVVSYVTDVRIAPNPATEMIRIVSNSDMVSTYRITDVAGREVRSGQVALGGTDVSLAGLAAGLYLYYEVIDDKFRFVTKFIKR